MELVLLSVLWILSRSTSMILMIINLTYYIIELVENYHLWWRTRRTGLQPRPWNSRHTCWGPGRSDLAKPALRSPRVPNIGTKPVGRFKVSVQVAFNSWFKVFTTSHPNENGMNNTCWGDLKFRYKWSHIKRWKEFQNFTSITKRLLEKDIRYN